MGDQVRSAADFGGLEVAAFESRRAKEMAALIANCGGVPLVAPAMREVPLEENPAAFAFVEKLLAGQIDAVIFMTGVGTRTLVEVLEARYPRERIVRALSGIVVVARGPKPVNVLRELQIAIAITVPEPNTWREVLRALEENSCGFRLKGSRVAVQEYGISNHDFLGYLRAHAAEVLRVPVYRWAFPEDTTALRRAVEAIAEGRIRVVMFTNAVQVDHVLQMASEQGLKERLLRALRDCVICSVGPTCSEALLAHSVPVDLEPTPNKMGILVREAAREAPALLEKKTNR